MDLRQRLRQIGGQPGGQPERLAPPPVIRRAPNLDRVLGGTTVETALGPAYLVERRYPRDHRHGQPVATLAHFDSDRLVNLTGDARLTTLDPARAIILDTETTGLAGGTGTYTFLIGLGCIEGDAFVIRQYFLRELTEEAALLAQVGDHLGECGGLITYNGRSFDAPLLATRFLLSRRRSALTDLAHWDVLPMARRLWKSRIGACNLSSLEASVLGQAREGDTPGWLIPQLYFDYLRDQDAGRLSGVFEHNRRDILALAALAGLICQILDDPLSTTLPDQHDLAALARHAEALGRWERARQLYQCHLERPLRPVEREEAERALSLLLKRSGDWPSALGLWQAMQERRLIDPAFPLLEMAKYYEHVAQDYRRASDLVERLLLGQTLRPGSGEVTALRQRLTRLERKVIAAQARAAVTPRGSRSRSPRAREAIAEPSADAPDESGSAGYSSNESAVAGSTD